MTYPFNSNTNSWVFDTTSQRVSLLEAQVRDLAERLEGLEEPQSDQVKQSATAADLQHIVSTAKSLFKQVQEALK